MLSGRSRLVATAMLSAGIALAAPAMPHQIDAVLTATRPAKPPPVYRSASKPIYETVTEPCGSFSLDLGGRRHNCAPATRRVSRTTLVTVTYDTYGQRGPLPDWVVERHAQDDGDPNSTVAPIRGLYEVKTTDLSGAQPVRIDRLCFETMRRVEALFQAHRGASCGPPRRRLVTSESVYIAGPCDNGSSRLEGIYDETMFRLHTNAIAVQAGASRSTNILVEGRRLSATCAPAQEPRW